MPQYLWARKLLIAAADISANHFVTTWWRTRQERCSYLANTKYRLYTNISCKITGLCSKGQFPCPHCWLRLNL